MVKSKGISTRLNSVGGGLEPQLTRQQQVALYEISVLQQSIEREQQRLGTVEGQGINTFISTNASDMQAQRNIRNYQSRIDNLRKQYGV